MATNGESARRWLEENQETVTPDRIRQIRDSLSNKLQALNESDDQHSGLLEALDIMDSHLLSLEQEAPSIECTEERALDLGPLISDNHQEAPQLSPDEKKLRFQQLLKTGKL